MLWSFLHVKIWRREIYLKYDQLEVEIMVNLKTRSAFFDAGTRRRFTGWSAPNLIRCHGVKRRKSRAFVWKRHQATGIHPRGCHRSFPWIQPLLRPCGKLLNQVYQGWLCTNALSLDIRSITLMRSWHFMSYLLWGPPLRVACTSPNFSSTVELNHTRGLRCIILSSCNHSTILSVSNH